ncbi:MAG TPA: hypothetical protein VIT23_16040, partial [Terrimicrobiaceae bacterium]
MEVFTEDDWHLSRKRHEARVRQWVAKRLERASRHQRHPVEDFLFEYYPYRPAKLLCWHPGFGVALQGESARSFLSHKYYRETAQGITVDILELPPSRKESIRWLYAMLRRTTERAASFGCRGLHEWAML